MSEKITSLDDLKGINLGGELNLTDVDVITSTDLKGPGETGDKSSILDSINIMADAAMERAGNRIIEDKEVKDIKKMTSEVSSGFNENNDVFSPSETKSFDPIIKNIDIDDADFDALGEDDLDVDGDIKLDKIKGQIKAMIKPITKKVDLSTFTINKKAESLFNVMKKVADETTTVTDWALFNSKIALSMREFKGTDIESLNPNNSKRTRYNAQQDMFAKIYSHITSKDLPTLEEFLKAVRYSDLDSLYYLIFKSSFSKKNPMPYQCVNDDCKEQFVEDVNVTEMPRFKSPESEKEFYDLCAQNNGSYISSEIQNEIVQISDNFVFELRIPTLFNVIFETLTINEEFREKHQDIITLLIYVERILYIDYEKNELIPVEYKIDPKSVGNTVGSKIKSYGRIIKDLSSDELALMQSIISKIVDDELINYVLPERRCPQCGTTIPEQRQSMFDLLFTRHRLGTLANS